MSSDQVSQVSEKVGEMSRIPNFPPSIWGDRFIKYNYEEDNINHASQLQEIEELKEQVREELLANVNQYSLPKQQLDLIDTIEHLGLGYHFETEVQQVLQHLYDTYNDDSHDHEYDLYNAALCFRLLRQHGHHVSCDKFNKFKDDKGNFKESLASDVSGMLSLYQAAYVGVHGEDILEEAIAFTAAHLQSMATHLTNPQLAAQVLHALRKPLHKRVPRIEARRYISVYQDEASHNQALLKLAKIDFNLLQSLHKKEISQLCRWAKNWDFIGKIPFARDRMVEGYFWVLGMVHEPQHSLARIIIAKVIYILTLIDDLYHVYGTLEELELFTEATERWDASCMNQLPEYMHIIYKTFLDFPREVEEEIADKGWRPYTVHCAKEAIKCAVRANFEEAKWINDNHIPTMEEYMRVSKVIAGLGTITILLLITMDLVEKETFDWVLSRPTFITTSELHLKLMDDIRSPKLEREKGQMPSSVEIYMKQYNVSEKEACEELQKRLDNAWKGVNEEFVKHTHDLPTPVPMFILNYPRVINLIYEKEDNYASIGEEVKNHIESLLIDPVTI
ncbi:hypothetical protein ACOSQ3_005780 [Xanthoceras sorbifolium]